MVIKWEKAFVFISSTFNDMHAERDYLVKKVFPQLREWCERRKLRLVDIDLRWGVTEEDASFNKRTVSICLHRIDECRPFFLCFIGQRRGWVPQATEVLDNGDYPGLAQLIGENSITEIEIHHAVSPESPGSIQAEPACKNYPSYSMNALFYVRDDAYLADLPEDPLYLREIFTNEAYVYGIERSPDARKKNDDALHTLRKVILDDFKGKHKVHLYNARWDPGQSTPEYLFPFHCSSADQTIIQSWQKRWEEKAGVIIKGDRVESDPVEAEKAKEFNAKLAKGRLTRFTFEAEPLSQVIIRDLQEAITQRFPGHQDVGADSELQREIDQQEDFLNACCEGYIERSNDVCLLDEYMAGNISKPFVLVAGSGMGKSTLLANQIDRHRTGGADTSVQLFYRFVGASHSSTTIDALLRSLLREMKEAAGLIDEEIPADPVKLREAWPLLLEKAIRSSAVTIVIDGLDQLDTGLSDLDWIPWQLLPGLRIVVSFKTDEPASRALADRLRSNNLAIVKEIEPFAEGERRLLAEKFLAGYLKALDKNQMDLLVRMPGAINPLYIKVVLSELRVFGAYSLLEEKIRNDFGDEPVTAFNGLLERLESDPSYSPIDPSVAVPVIFGLLAVSRHGLSENELVDIMMREHIGGTLDREAISDTVNLYLRQVRPFLARREQRYDYFYESFRNAAQKRYVSEKGEDGHHKRVLKNWHVMLARHFEAQPLWDELAVPMCGYTRKPNYRKVAEEAYHETCGELWEALEYTLGNLEPIEAKCAAVMVYDLLQDQKRAIALRPSTIIAMASRALSKSLPEITLRPSNCLQALYNYLLWSSDTSETLQHGLGQSKSMLDQRGCWISLKAPIMNGEESLDNIPLDIVSPIQSISYDGNTMAVATRNGDAEIRDLTSGKLLGTRHIRARGISAICLMTDPLSIAYFEGDGHVRIDTSEETLQGRAGEKVMAYHPKIGILAVRDDNALVAWQPGTANTPIILAEKLPSPLISIKLHRNGDKVLFIAGQRQQEIGVIRQKGSKWEVSILPYKGPPAVDADLDSEAKHVLIASIDHQLHILEIETGAIITKIPYERQTGIIVHGSPKACSFGMGDRSKSAYLATDFGHVVEWAWDNGHLERYEDCRHPDDPVSEIHCTVHPTTGTLLVSTERQVRKYTCKDKRNLASIKHGSEVTACYMTQKSKLFTISDRDSIMQGLSSKNFELSKQVIQSPTAICGLDDLNYIVVGDRHGQVLLRQDTDGPCAVIAQLDDTIASLCNTGINDVIAGSVSGEILQVKIPDGHIKIITRSRAYQALYKVLPAGDSGLFWTLSRDDSEQSLFLISLTHVDGKEEIILATKEIIKDIAYDDSSRTLCIAGKTVRALRFEGGQWKETFHKDVAAKNIAMTANNHVIAILDEQPWLEIWELALDMPTVASTYLSGRASCLCVKDGDIGVGFQGGEVLIAHLEVLSRC